jgi:hypothetical protein
MRVLVVEDEAKLAGLLRRGLTVAGLAADVVDRARTRCGWPLPPATTRSCSTFACPASTVSRPVAGCAPTASALRC